MTSFRYLVAEAAGLAAATPEAALACLADELETLITSECFTHYQHQRLTAICWAMRMTRERVVEE